MFVGLEFSEAHDTSRLQTWLQTLDSGGYLRLMEVGDVLGGQDERLLIVELVFAGLSQEHICHRSDQSLFSLNCWIHLSARSTCPRLLLGLVALASSVSQDLIEHLVMVVRRVRHKQLLQPPPHVSRNVIWHSIKVAVIHLWMTTL